MALHRYLFTLLLFALAHVSVSQVLNAKVSCFDCSTPNHDLSGIRVSIKCDNFRKVVVATTEEDGSFSMDLPIKRDSKNSIASNNNKEKCEAKLLGGPNQLYALEKDKVSLIVKGTEPNTFTTSKPLGFFTSCPMNTDCEAVKQFGASETFDIPLPPEWGLAPSSYYIPFFPIIGIP